MASCSPFSVEFSGSPQDLFNKIAALIHEHGGTISGGPTGGAFSVPVPVFGTVAGTFSVSGQTVTIHITRRSFFLPCSAIESFIRSNIPTVAATITQIAFAHASCSSFNVEFSGSAQDLFNKVAALIHEHGGTISGGPTGGAFSVSVPVFGTVAGTFSVSGQTVTIHITRRPFFLPCSTIESFIRSNIPTVVATAITEF